MPQVRPADGEGPFRRHDQDQSQAPDPAASEGEGSDRQEQQQQPGAFFEPDVEVAFQFSKPFIGLQGACREEVFKILISEAHGRIAPTGKFREVLQAGCIQFWDDQSAAGIFQETGIRLISIQGHRSPVSGADRKDRNRIGIAECPGDALCRDDITNFVGKDENTAAGDIRLFEEVDGQLQRAGEPAAGCRDDIGGQTWNHCRNGVRVVCQR